MKETDNFKTDDGLMCMLTIRLCLSSPHTAHCAICRRVNKQCRVPSVQSGPSAYPKSILGRYCNTIGYDYKKESMSKTVFT